MATHNISLIQNTLRHMIPVLNNPTTRLDLMVAIFFFDDGFQIIDSFTIEKEQEKYGSRIFFFP